MKLFRVVVPVRDIEAASIRTRDWGESSFYGRDPWGNKIVFVAAGTEFTGGRFVP